MEMKVNVKSNDRFYRDEIEVSVKLEQVNRCEVLGQGRRMCTMFKMNNL